MGLWGVILGLTVNLILVCLVASILLEIVKARKDLEGKVIDRTKKSFWKNSTPSVPAFLTDEMLAEAEGSSLSQTSRLIAADLIRDEEEALEEERERREYLVKSGRLPRGI